MNNFIRILLISLLFLIQGHTLLAKDLAADSLSNSTTDSLIGTPSIPIMMTEDTKTQHAEFDVVNDTIHKQSSIDKKQKSYATKEYFKPDAKKATWYALVCPGLGQIYNRSYWKLPILYGGVLTFTYLISWNGRMYNDYHNAYHDIMDTDPNTNSYRSLVPGYTGTDSWLQSTLKTKTNRYRRARDLSTFGLVAFYMVSVIDAFVDAHLYDFTVTDDLSMRVEPVINTYGFGNSLEPQPSPTVGLQCSIHFK